MQTISFLVFSIFIIWLAVKLFKFFFRREDDYQFPENRQEEQEEGKLPYHRKDYLLTLTEKKFYDVLKRVAEKNNLVIQSKVRLEDLIEVDKQEYNQWKWRGHIRSYHIDFTLCDKQTLRLLIAIELDDYFHSRPDRQKRDSFVERALESAGLPLLRFTVKSFYDENEISNQILTVQNK
mgnify:CR=1 FL=1